MITKIAADKSTLTTRSLRHVSKSAGVSLIKGAVRDGNATGAVQELRATITHHFSAVRGVDAVFMSVDDEGWGRIFAVVREFDATIYRKIMAAEQRVEKALRSFRFEFRVRAHQGRPPSSAVPSGSELVFAR